MLSQVDFRWIEEFSFWSADCRLQIIDTHDRQRTTHGHRDRDRTARSTAGRFEIRSIILAVMLAVVWIELLHDPQSAWLMLILLGGLGIALGLMGAAMGLGFLGFGLCMAGDRVMGWLRRASQWPDE